MVHPISKLLQRQAPVIMGVLNLTPDSFSDGIPHAGLQTFVEKAEALIAEGADIIDVGGESTRPHAESVTLDEEKKRVLPFLEKFRKKFPAFPLSLDTKKYGLALDAVKYTVHILNDVSFLSDPRMLELALQHDCYYILMHSRGDAQTMMNETAYPQGVVDTMMDEINARLTVIKKTKLFPDRVILDLGFGFAKTPDQCVVLMNNLDVWQKYHLPLLLGISRKRFLQKYTGENAPHERDIISAQLALKACGAGFKIIRTHNVKMTREYLNNHRQTLTPMDFSDCAVCH
ncbi:MAG: dihydropteroate synthase [Deltaproteobacteria bacterium]|nr:dihydropteroate synthase [Deltaproteobacteria bacterium]